MRHKVRRPLLRFMVPKPLLWLGYYSGYTGKQISYEDIKFNVGWVRQAGRRGVRCHKRRTLNCLVVELTGVGPDPPSLYFLMCWLSLACMWLHVSVLRVSVLVVIRQLPCAVQQRSRAAGPAAPGLRGAHTDLRRHVRQPRKRRHHPEEQLTAASRGGTASPAPGRQAGRQAAR